MERRKTGPESRLSPDINTGGERVHIFQLSQQGDGSSREVLFEITATSVSVTRLLYSLDRLTEWIFRAP